MTPAKVKLTAGKFAVTQLSIFFWSHYSGFESTSVRNVIELCYFRKIISCRADGVHRPVTGDLGT
eukprot:SAG11_NODE_1129_length_5761_cov_296.866302_1_plen_65_part_00